MTPFCAGVRGRSVDPVIHSRLRIITEKSSLGLGALQERDLHQPAFDRQQVEVAADVVAADHVEDDVDAAAAGRLPSLRRPSPSVR